MSAPKVGDRVHVSFEAEVQTDVDHGWLRVFDSDAKVDLSVPASACTVIVPPIKVGDVVTEANIGQLPVHSVVGYPGKQVNERVGHSAHPWFCTNGDVYRDSNVIGSTVLRIGGGL